MTQHNKVVKITEDLLSESLLNTYYTVKYYGNSDDGHSSVNRKVNIRLINIC